MYDRDEASCEEELNKSEDEGQIHHNSQGSDMSELPEKGSLMSLLTHTSNDKDNL